ncbi:MAG: galactokinase [Kiritimatiellia bacterium]
MNKTYTELTGRFGKYYGSPHTSAAYAPGRIEVLGNHTDYNEGFVLSAAIDMGTFFAAAPSPDAACRVVAGDIMEEASFDSRDPSSADVPVWAAYVRGVFAELRQRGMPVKGFNGMFLSNLPLAAGLSSSAALEMSAGLAISNLQGFRIDKHELAKAGQSAEHRHVGVKCGLLDQITSLFGRNGCLVMTDFRSFSVKHAPLPQSGGRTCFLMCDTGVKHNLVESEYNARREECARAVEAFSSLLSHPVTALRDVSMDEWNQYSPKLEASASRRSAHVIGENTRVLRAQKLLADGRLADFGALMFESHESSRCNFENSCPELDFLVERAAETEGVLGARLSGGGFGGSAVVLTRTDSAGDVARELDKAYEKRFGRSCKTRKVIPSGGASVLA